MRFDNFVLLHGKGGSPKGSVKQLEEELRHCLPTDSGDLFQRPKLLHSDPNVLRKTLCPILRHETCHKTRR